MSHIEFKNDTHLGIYSASEWLEKTQFIITKKIMELLTEKQVDEKLDTLRKVLKKEFKQDRDNLINQIDEYSGYLLDEIEKVKDVSSSKESISKFSEDWRKL